MPEGPTILMMAEETAKFVGKPVRAAGGNAKIDYARLLGRKPLAIRSWGKHFLVDFGEFSVRAHLLLFGSYHSLVRSRVTATATGLTVVNGYRARRYEWSQIISVSLRRGAPWGTLDLSDGTTVSLIGVQGSDGARAQRAIREIRATIAANTPD